MKRLIIPIALLGTCCLSPIRAAADEEYFVVLGHDIARFAAAEAKIDATAAIDAATESANEPVFALVQLVLDGPTPIYEVVFLAPNGPSEVELDAVTGKVIPLVVEPPTPAQRAEGMAKREAISGAEIDLRRAIEVAASQVKNGRVVRAEADVNHGAVTFAVEVLLDGAFKMVTLGPDGKVKNVGESKDEPGGRAWTFDRNTIGEPPPGWSFGFTYPETGKAQWLVERNPKPMTGPNALRLFAESGPRTFNVAMATNTSYGDVDVRTRLRPVTGQVDQGGGLVWRCSDANNYYVCRINPLESNFRVYRVIDGQRHQLQSASVATEPGTWYAIRAKMIGDHIMCFLDGRKLLDVHDGVLKDAGMVGLWTKADASSAFDNVAVRNGVESKSDSAPVVEPAAISTGRRDHDDDDDDE